MEQEIFNGVYRKIKEGKQIPEAPRMSPKTGKPMTVLNLLGGSLAVDFCLDSEGMWFDKGEMEKLASGTARGISIKMDRITEKKEKPSATGPEETDIREKQRTGDIIS